MESHPAKRHLKRVHPANKNHLKNSTFSILLGVFLVLSALGCSQPQVHETQATATNSEVRDSIPREPETASDEEGAEADYEDDVDTLQGDLVLAFIREELLPQDEWQTLALEDRKYAAASWDLDADGNAEILFTIPTSYFCGSGGCDLWVLTDKGSLISKTTVVRFPIGISTQKTKGWFDLFTHSNGEDHALRFGGAGYSSNASTAEVVSASERQSLTQVEVLEDPYGDYSGF